MRKLLLLLYGCFGFSFLGVCQQAPRPTINLELLVQELMAQQESDELAYEDIYENLLQFYQTPINLNKTTPDELTSLLLLTPAQIQALNQHISENGRLASIYELQIIPGFDLNTIYKILPFVTVQDINLLEDTGLWNRIKASDNHYFLLRYDRTLQTRRGYTAPDTIGTRLTSRYTGSPDKILMRYRNSHARDFSFGFTAEKDAGEPLTWNRQNKQYGLDFHSAHFQLYNKGRFKAIALGDYQLQFGQGLLLSSGFSVGKGSETITTIRRSNVGIRPYSSVLETGFFRGAAVTYALDKNIELTGFYSSKNIDASLSAATDTLEEIDVFSGIQVSGFHRTPTEIGNKHQVGEQVYGSNITYKNLLPNLTTGITVLQTTYANPLQRREAPYTLFEFAGRRNLNIGLHYTYNWQNISFFGETARSSSGGLGTVNGLLASLSKYLDLSLVYRNYQRHFHTFYGNAFGENTRNINEAGWYTGIKLKPGAKWELTAYYDRFRFPWLRYRVDAPSRGDEYLVRLFYKPTKTALLYAQIRGESKGLNATESERQLPGILPAARRSYLLYFDYSPAPNMNLRTRVQGSQYRHDSPQTTGYYLGQEVSVDIKRLTLSTRFALFDTDKLQAVFVAK